LRKYAEGLPNVKFYGWLSGAETRRHLRSAFALCVPSIVAAGGDAEGLPSVVVEAMSEGVPVIASASAGVAEAVENGETGLLVEPGQPEAIARAVQRLVSQPALRDKLSKAAQRACTERFNAAVQSRRLETLFLDIIEKRSGRTPLLADAGT
jgi:glycosyltransferase involved in cell wall biosynthesis